MIGVPESKLYDFGMEYSHYFGHTVTSFHPMSELMSMDIGHLVCNLCCSVESLGFYELNGVAMWNRMVYQWCSQGAKGPQSCQLWYL